MKNDKTVQDIMVGIFEYPHVPYWFSISQVIKIAKASFFSNKEYHGPMAILVFDEKYNLLGSLALKNILKGLEPKFLSPARSTQSGEGEDEPELSLIWDTLFHRATKEVAEIQVSEVMNSVKLFVAPEDPVTKAAYLMLHNDAALLPVLENKRKLVGLVRFIDVYEEISNTLLAE